MSSMKLPKNLANNPSASVAEAQETEPSEGVSEESSCSCVPRLALRCDGRILLSVTDLEGVDLASRERWVGIVLSEAEASDIHERLDYEQAASPTVARIRALDKKAKKKTTSSDDDNNDT